MCGEGFRKAVCAVRFLIRAAAQQWGGIIGIHEIYNDSEERSMVGATGRGRLSNVNTLRAQGEARRQTKGYMQVKDNREQCPQG